MNDQFNQKQDYFNNILKQWLKNIIKNFDTGETAEQFPSVGAEYFSVAEKRRTSFIHYKQKTVSNKIRLNDFIEDIRIILSDELNGEVTKISASTLLIEFPGGDVFRLKLMRDVASGDDSPEDFFDSAFGRFRGLRDS